MKIIKNLYTALAISCLFSLAPLCAMEKEKEDDYGQSTAEVIQISEYQEPQVLPLTDLAAHALLKLFALDNKSLASQKLADLLLGTYVNDLKCIQHLPQELQNKLAQILDAKHSHLLESFLPAPHIINFQYPLKFPKISKDSSFSLFLPERHFSSLLSTNFQIPGLIFNHLSKEKKPVSLGQFDRDSIFKLLPDQNCALIVSLGFDNNISKLDLPSTKISSSYKFPLQRKNTYMAPRVIGLSKDNKYMLLMLNHLPDRDLHIELMDIASQKLKHTVVYKPKSFSTYDSKGYFDNNNHIALSLDFLNCTTQLNEYQNSLHSSTTGKELFVLPPGHICAGFNQDSTQLFSYNKNKSKLYLWDLETFKIAKVILISDYVNTYISKAKFTKNDQVKVTTNLAVYLLDTTNRHSKCIFKKDDITSLRSNDGLVALNHLFNIYHSESHSQLTHKPTQKSYCVTPELFKGKFSPAGDFFCMNKNIESKEDDQFCIFDTHRTLTNGSSLPATLALLVIQKQKNNDEVADSQLIDLINKDGNMRLKELSKNLKKQVKIASHDDKSSSGNQNPNDNNCIIS